MQLNCDNASGDAELEEQLAGVLREAFELWKQRHRKYGPLNIAFSGEVGCVVRSGDKIARLAEYHLHGKHEAGDESVEDSWLDLLNYAAMGLLCRRKLWRSR